MHPKSQYHARFVFYSSYAVVYTPPRCIPWLLLFTVLLLVQFILTVTWCTWRLYSCYITNEFFVPFL
ncbi:hypothetical protein M408DRAFT_110110 [Serendipita vermifera MAFF 305830]|uniref:Uncharacterized protein n=1 Tax=Serendipita vermifera MAFF 305830 TaxID=933852 RepID=A0A0C2WV53_SERVB|nr:hypothetical protein M408DRAFT_110110 [Serendipita vermifera MAFF 305830]